ncbi:MAG: sigma-54-dependent Fis family transcriptional regulator [Thiomonas sp. 15-66-11]|jgi:two-component system response regulator PilR (NtrC family)|nr:MAG: sigma-54-dependent Fis family transcriptional regulator [Thiomonas sp. 15-66-11]
MPEAATPIRILVVDDEPDLRELYTLTLVREGWEVEEAASVGEARARMAQQGFDVAIVDMRLPDGEGLDILAWAAAQRRAERIVMATAYGNAATAVQALKMGAFDYLTKPVDLRQLRQVVRSALAQGAAAGSLDRQASALLAMVGDSAPMLAVKDTLRRAARGMAPVLIQGESGTGKELAARAVHELSNRAAGPFVPVNCSAIPEHLLEAEFFGYRKGAFTGALASHDGFFAAAAGGTLFLDELGELPLSMQAKLLRAVQERKVRALGEIAETPVDVRLVSATHRDLQRCVAEGTFRQDLYYRLNVIGVTLPPLRERLDDLPQLVEALLGRIRTDHGRPGLRLSQDALQQLRLHAFAGNVRELENLLHRATALAATDLIGPQDLDPPAEMQPPLYGAVAAPPGHGGIGWTQPPARRDAGTQPVAAWAPPALPLELSTYLDQIERNILLEALRRTRFNRTAAAQLLGLNLRQIRYRMERLDIRDEGAASESYDEPR